MSFSSTNHPSEEQLMEFALKGGNREIEEHCAICEKCSHEVADYKKVGDAVISIDDEEIPRLLERSILDFRKRQPGRKVQNWLTNPLLMVVVITLMLLFLYYFMGMIFIAK